MNKQNRSKFTFCCFEPSQAARFVADFLLDSAVQLLGSVQQSLVGKVTAAPSDDKNRDILVCMKYSVIKLLPCEFSRMFLLAEAKCGRYLKKNGEYYFLL